MDAIPLTPANIAYAFDKTYGVARGVPPHEAVPSGDGRCKECWKPMKDPIHNVEGW